MSAFESTYATPLAWIASRLAEVPSAPGRRAVVLVAAERYAHAIRRHVCVDLAHPEQLAGVLFTHPADLAREVVIRAGRMHLPEWDDVRRMRILQLFESAALQGQLRYFNADQLRSGQGYVDAFARTISDLEWSGLDAASTLAVAQRLAVDDPLGAHRLHDVALAWKAADAPAGPYLTTAQLLNVAAEALAARPELLTTFGPIFAMLSAAPSTVLLRFLRALPGCRSVFQEARPQRSGTQRWREFMSLRAPAPVLEAAGSPAGNGTSDSELHLVQQYLFELPETLTAPNRPRSAGPDGTVDLEEYPGIEDEIEAAGTWVAEQLAVGVAVEHIALIVPEIEPYAPLLIDRLARIAGDAPATALQAYVASGLSFAESPGGMRLHALLNAIARRLEAEATIRILPALRRGPQDTADSRARLSASRAAEIVYGAGIVGGSPGDATGISEWITRLTRRRDAWRKLVNDAEAAAKERPDEPEKRRHAMDQKTAARWLRDVEPILPAIAALQRLAEQVFAGASLRVVWQELRGFAEQWLRIPPDPPALLALLEERLQPVLRDPVADAVSGVSAVEFLIDALRRERRAMLRFGEPGVFIGTASHAAGLPFVAVRILGMAEGALPHTPHDDPIVPDGLRARIETAARAQRPDVVVPRLADHVLDDIHDIFRVVSGAEQRLTLSAPRQWVDRSDREVSGIMLEVATALGRTAGPQTDDGDVPTAARLRAAYLNPGRDARQRAADAYAGSPRALLNVAQRTAAQFAVPAGWAADDARSVERLHALNAAQRDDAWGAVDGMVTEPWPAVRVPGLTPEHPISASALTVLLGCPHRFLLERVLHLRDPAGRPSTDVIEATAYGSLFHAAAERFFHEAGAAVCRREGSLDHWIERARHIASAQFDALIHEYPLRGADGIERERGRLLRQMEHLVRYEWQREPREFLESEVTFGDPEAVRLTLDNGDLYVWGAIDRVDRIGPAALSVRDLKTGRVYDFGEQPPNALRDLQIGLYTLALEASGYAEGTPVVEAAYVHPSAAQQPDRAFAGADLETLRRRTRSWLSVARSLLSAGAFPRSPNADDCRYCPFVPACGDGAQQRSAVKLANLAAGHALEAFVRFKHEGDTDGG